METLIKILEEQVERYDEMVEKKADDFTYEGDIFPIKEFNEHLKPEQAIMRHLGKILRYVKPVTKWEELSEHGDVFSIKEFSDMCKCGGFIDYDGFGYYVKDGMEADIMVKPSDLSAGLYRDKEFDSVIWFNR